jgi:hypothetical protein
MTGAPDMPPALLNAHRCGSNQPIIAVDPGEEPVIEAGIRLTKGRPMRAFCRACWPCLDAVKNG